MKLPSMMCAEMWKLLDIFSMFKFDIHTTVFLKTRVLHLRQPVQ
jgi:hypothetical protein